MSKIAKVLVIIGMIIAFLIIFGLINLSRQDNGEKTPGLIALFLFFGLIFVARKIWKYKSPEVKGINSPVTNYNKLDLNRNISSPPSSLSEIELLLDLYKKNVLSESEYNEKLNQYNQRLQEEKEKKENELFDKELQKRIQPILNQLNELKKTNLLSDIEFNKKSNQVIDEYSNKLRLEIINKELLLLSNNYDDTINFDDLSIDEKNIVRKLKITYSSKDYFLKNKNSGNFVAVGKNQWNAMQHNGEYNNYLFIIR